MKHVFITTALILVIASSFVAGDHYKQTRSLVKNDADSSYATLYAYREKSLVGSLIGYNLSVGDSVVCRIKNNSKYIIKLYKQGPVEISAKTEKKTSVKLNVEFGKEYYLKCSIKTGIMEGRPQLELVYPEQGKLDFQNVEGRNKDNDREQ